MLTFDNFERFYVKTDNVYLDLTEAITPITSAFLKLTTYHILHMYNINRKLDYQSFTSNG